MKIISQKACLSGHIQVPGSKSHTIRALLLASLAEGESHIYNPLPSADCLSTASAVPLIGAKIDFNNSSNKNKNSVWTVYGAGKSIHLPSDVVNVGNSGSLLYFLSPIAATFEGWSIFTGDQSILSRPVNHVVDSLNQLGANAYVAKPNSTTCPLIIKGPIDSLHTLKTEGSISSQYISGFMMAALRLKKTLTIELTNPKETPYLTMTQKWLEKCGAKVFISNDFKSISVSPVEKINAFDVTIPGDWEAVAFPLIAAVLTDSKIIIDDVDSSGTQGDDAIVDVLLSLGADIVWNKTNSTLQVCGMKKSKDGVGRLSTEKLPNKELHVNLSGFPDAICAIAVVACFTEGTTVLEDISVCRKKETDRVEVLKTELTRLGAEVEVLKDSMIIHGHSPLNADGTKNCNFKLHGGTVESYKDHRVAMAFSCMGLALPNTEKIIINDAECCSVSFPNFYNVMNNIGANYIGEK